MTTPSRALAFDPVRRAIAAAMKRRKIEPRDLDRAANLTSGHVARILDGRIASSDIVTLCLIAEALEIEIGKLVPRDEIVEIYLAEIRWLGARKKRA